jgi:hypothetical protein
VVRLYGSATDSSANGSGPSIDDDEQTEEDFEGTEYDYSQLFDAPSYSEFIKTAPNSKARSYEKRVQSMMKAGMVMSLNNHDWPDAATFLKHGPGFAKAAGNLAAEDERAARIVDMMTAPDSPYIMFVMVAIPMIAQLTRNHQADIVKAAETRKSRRAARKDAKAAGVKPPKNPVRPITVHLFKREWKLPIGVRVKMPNLKKAFQAFLAPTQYPNEIAGEVFNDPSVRKALHKMGIFPRGEEQRYAEEDE